MFQHHRKKRILQCILGEQQFWQQFWPDNWLPFSTSNRNRPQMAGLSLASRSFSQDLESEAMVSGSEARMWNIRILKCFRRVHEGFLCRYMSLLYVTVCHRSFIMFHHVFGSQVASTLLSFCVEGTSFGTGLGPRNTGTQDRSDRMRSGAHAKATSNVSVASAASAAASQVADLIFMDHHGSSWIIMNHVTMSCPDAGFSYLVFQDLNVF